jgi:hypothetical protein
MQSFAAGDYYLTVDTTTANVADYSFRVLDTSAATPLTIGETISDTLTPGNGVRIYQFEANAGEKYFFDSVIPPGQYWSLIDPLGHTLFDTSSSSDEELQTFKAKGTYFLAIRVSNDQVTPSPYNFKVVLVPNNPVVVFDTLAVKPAPDLSVNNLTLDPASSLETGQMVHVQWVLENRGQIPTVGSWNDRIVVRNLDSGQVLAAVTVPYDEAADGNGSIGINEARTRSVDLRLPEGPSAIGRIGITLSTDADNVIKESNTGASDENNNVRSIEVQVALAKYADLVAEDVVLSPDGNYAAGTNVTVSWNTVNRGNRDADRSWNERLEIRNLSTNELIASSTLRDDVGIDGALVVGSARAHAVQFIWPSGLSSAGEFSFQIVLDSAGELPEANEQGNGESNNAVELLRTSGPDLLVKNLQIEQSLIEAGGLLTIDWETWNGGLAPAAADFREHIVITNKSTGETLLDTSVVYDSTQQGAGFIEPNDLRNRSFNFRLPDGFRGVGNIEISVTADQNSAGFGTLFETNQTSDAESNKGLSTRNVSQAKD